MSCSKLIIQFRNGQSILHQQFRQLSSLSEIRQSNVRSKPTATDQIKSDIVIVGDGVLANSIAYWLRSTNPNNQSVTVIESENFIQNKFNTPCYSQFNSVEGIQLSKFTKQFISRLNADFKLRPTKEHLLETNSSLNDHQLIEQKSSIGLLQLCESLAGETELIKYNKLFKQLFASTEYASELLNSKQLNEMFTWLDSDNVRLGRFHSRDDLALTNINLLQLNDVLRKKAEQLGVQYVKGKIKEMNANNRYEEDMYGVTSLRKSCNDMVIDRYLNKDLYNLTNLKFKKLIIATPANQSKMIANKLGLDRTYQWPVEGRQRLIYEIYCKDLQNENIPVIVDSFGLWLKKDQKTGNFYCGLNNQEHLAEEDLNKITNFSKYVWPRLVSYISSLKNIEIINVHQQNYDYNLDEDIGIVGLHPDISNLYWVLGFNGNHEGIWAPGLGRATSELVNQKRFNIINLDKLGFRRKTLNSSRLKQRLSN